jgi:hypothetical protein
VEPGAVDLLSEVAVNPKHCLTGQPQKTLVSIDGRPLNRMMVNYVKHCG